MSFLYIIAQEIDKKNQCQNVGNQQRTEEEMSEKYVGTISNDICILHREPW